MWEGSPLNDHSGGSGSGRYGGAADVTELNPFDAALAEKTKAQATPFDEALGKKQKQKGYKYSVLPLSEDEQGKVRFDSNAGIVGAIKRAVTLPGDVATGKVDPMSQGGMRRAVELGLMATPPITGRVAPAVPEALKSLQQSKTPAPTAEELVAAGGEGYRQARELGVQYRPSSVNLLAEQARLGINDEGLIAQTAPTTHSIIDLLAQQQPEGATAPFTAIHAARKAFSKVAKQRGPDGRPTPDAAASSSMLGRIDSFLENPDPAAVLAGAAPEAGRIVKEANANYGAGLRSKELGRIENETDLKSAAANSGLNLDNTIRRHVTSLLLNPKTRAGFSKDELKALEEVARGTPSRNALRMVGNLLGGGGGLGSVVTSVAGSAAGGAAGGPLGATVGAAAPVIGYLAKKAGNAKTLKALEKADEKVRKRSPLFEKIRAEAPVESPSQDGRVLLMRALGLSFTPQSDMQYGSQKGARNR